MNKKEYMEAAEQSILHTYNRFPAVFDHGKGVYLYDTDGRQYLDFASGIGVMALGYGNEEYSQALKDQADRLLHTSNLYYNVPTEAVEGALKAAKKYAYTKDGRAGHEIIAMQGSFHGRTVGALSVTGNSHYREPFEPLMGGVRFASLNDLESVQNQVTDNTCAVILETIQGESGIHPAKREFLEGLRSLCDEHDILLILDEIQCGMGRTGQMFAWQHYGIRPDIMTTAKALGCGVPVGAFLMTERVAEKSLAPGDHGTTYGGNPFVGAAVSKVFDLYESLHLTEHVRKVSVYLEQRLDEIIGQYDFLTGRRGMGLMQGVVTEKNSAEIAAKALEAGLIVITAGADVIRILPPLVITEADVDEMVKKFKGVLDTY